MSCWVFFGRCSLYRGLANTAMHLTRPLQLPVAQRDPEPAAFCGQVMAGVRQTQSLDVNAVFLRTQQIFLSSPNPEPVYRSA